MGLFDYNSALVQAKQLQIITWASHDYTLVWLVNVIPIMPWILVLPGILFNIKTVLEFPLLRLGNHDAIFL